jgi:hypothetical protein
MQSPPSAPPESRYMEPCICKGINCNIEERLAFMESSKSIKTKYIQAKRPAAACWYLGDGETRGAIAHSQQASLCKQVHTCKWLKKLRQWNKQHILVDPCQSCQNFFETEWFDYVLPRKENFQLKWRLGRKVLWFQNYKLLY